MKKKITIEELTNTTGPMNSVAKDDAKYYLGLDGSDELTPTEERALRAKKNKIVTSTKKHDRKASKEVLRKHKQIDK